MSRDYKRRRFGVAKKGIINDMSPAIQLSENIKDDCLHVVCCAAAMNFRRFSGDLFAESTPYCFVIYVRKKLSYVDAVCKLKSTFALDALSALKSALKTFLFGYLVNYSIPKSTFTTANITL